MTPGARLPKKKAGFRARECFHRWIHTLPNCYTAQVLDDDDDDDDGDDDDDDDDDDGDEDDDDDDDDDDGGGGGDDDGDGDDGDDDDGDDDDGDGDGDDDDGDDDDDDDVDGGDDDDDDDVADMMVWTLTMTIVHSSEVFAPSLDGIRLFWSTMTHLQRCHNSPWSLIFIKFRQKTTLIAFVDTISTSKSAEVDAGAIDLSWFWQHFYAYGIVVSNSRQHDSPSWKLATRHQKLTGGLDNLVICQIIARHFQNHFTILTLNWTSR